MNSEQQEGAGGWLRDGTLSPIIPGMTGSRRAEEQPAPAVREERTEHVRRSLERRNLLAAGLTTRHRQQRALEEWAGALDAVAGFRQVDQTRGRKDLGQPVR